MNTKKLFFAFLASFLSTASFAQKPSLNIVFIGNSITQGVQLADPATEAPPATTVAWLRKQKSFDTVNFSNQGHSGYTTLDFLPGTSTFSIVEQAAGNFSNKNALLIFSVKLGTNDSAITGTHGAPVAPDVYEQNLKTIFDKLLADFPAAIIIIQHPIWYSPNTYNGAQYLQEGLTRLQSYTPKIDELVARYAASNPNHVFTGDTRSFDYFKTHYLTDLIPEKGHQGTFYLHPNRKGAAALGEFWGKAILHRVKQLH